MAFYEWMNCIGKQNSKKKPTKNAIKMLPIEMQNCANYIGLNGQFFFSFRIFLPNWLCFGLESMNLCNILCIVQCTNNWHAFGDNFQLKTAIQWHKMHWTIVSFNYDLIIIEWSKVAVIYIVMRKYLNCLLCVVFFMLFLCFRLERNEERNWYKQTIISVLRP